MNTITAYSFECYVCNGKTEEECTSKQTKVNCTGDDNTCWKANYKTEKDKTAQTRGCVPKKSCEEIKKKCDDGEEIPQDDGDRITKCDVACCVTAAGAKNPCNGAITSTTTTTSELTKDCLVYPSTKELYFILSGIC